MNSKFGLTGVSTLLVLAVLAACSGGGGGGGTTANLALFAGNMDGIGNVDGNGAAARFQYPNGVATDSAGNVYVADTYNHTIRKITPAGVVSTVAGVAGLANFVPGALPGALVYPRDVAVIGTSLYITMNNGVAVVTNVP